MGLLSWMDGVKANTGVRMKNTGPREPSIGQDLHPCPRQAMSLASMDQSGPPEQDNPVAKHGQIVDISRYRVVVEVTLHDRAKPLSRSWDRSCMRLRSCCLIFQQLCSHSLVNRFTLQCIASIPVFPVRRRESQKVERFGLPFSSPVRLTSANRPNSIRRVLSGCSSSPNFRIRSRTAARIGLRRPSAGNRVHCHPHTGRQRHRLARISCAEASTDRSNT